MSLFRAGLQVCILSFIHPLDASLAQAEAGEVFTQLPSSWVSCCLMPRKTRNHKKLEGARGPSPRDFLNNHHLVIPHAVGACGGQRTTCGSWFFTDTVWVPGLNSACQTWQQRPLPAEPDHQPQFMLFQAVRCLVPATLGNRGVYAVHSVNKSGLGLSAGRHFDVRGLLSQGEFDAPATSHCLKKKSKCNQSSASWASPAASHHPRGCSPEMSTHGGLSR